tara:strand:+ start:139 stop:729 length:591 start_codon:yes stop_codon:yes gene_type:complete
MMHQLITSLKGHNMTQVNIATINTEIETTIRDWSTSTVKTDLARIKRTDTLRSAGWASTHCISPKSEGSEATDESWAFLKNTINSGLPKGAQDMLTMSAKVCGDKTVNGQSRAYWMRQANAVIGDIKTQLKRREDIASEVASGKTGPDARTVSTETKVRELLNDAIKRIQKADVFDCSIDLDDLTTGLAKLAKTIG